MKKRGVKNARVIAAAAMAVALANGSSSALAKNWNAGTGNWAVGGNWSPASVPTAGETVNIVFGDGVARTVTYNMAAPSLSLLTIDLTGTGTTASTLSMPSGINLAANGILIGGYNGITSAQTTGRGAVIQSAGTMTTNAGWDFVLGHGAGSIGTYTLSGTGALTANQSEYVGLSGNGTVDHSAGTNTQTSAAGFFIIGSNVGATGTYNLSGTGVVSSASHQYVGYVGSGTFNQSGGSNTITGNKSLYLGFNAGSTGTYALSGGTLSAYTEFVGFNGTGTFTHSGGTNSIVSDGTINVGAAGTYTLSGTGVISGGFQQLINGNFTQTGGTNNCSSMNVASNGVYNLSGGSLISGNPQTLGASTAGTFTQTGGTSTVLRVFMGTSPGGNGTFNISGGSTVVNSDVWLAGTGGPAGTGVLNVSGTGILSIVGGLNAYNTVGTSVNLSGGTINAAALNFNGVPSLLNWTGGKLNVTSNVTWDSAAAGTSTSAALGSSRTLGNTQTLMITGNETIGGTGAFALTLNSGSTHHVTGSVTLNPTGTITQNTGSTLYASTFTQAGGTVNGTLQNQGHFIYQSGAFSGRLLNQGTVNLGASFTAGNGIQNDTSIAIATGQTVIVNGAGLDNQSIIALSGGTIGGAGPVVNNGAISGFGMIGGTSAGFTNNGGLTVSGGSITLSNSAVNANTSSINLSAGLQLKLNGAALANTGMINLNGGTVNGTAALNNNAGGVIAGSGTIAAALSNNAGATLLVQTGTINLTQATANAGTINLAGPGSTLAGANIANNGIVRGDGVISSTLTNSSTGEIRADGGKWITIAAMSSPNAGKINLVDGTAEFTAPLTNSPTGLIIGRGTLRANGGLTNIGQVQLSGGAGDYFGNVTNTNGAKVIITGSATGTFYNNVTNNSGSEFRVSTGATAVFFGAVNGTAAFTGGGTKIFEGGAPSNLAGIATQIGDSIVDPSAAVAAGYVREDGLEVRGLLTISPDGSAAGTSRVNTLAIAGGGRFDLTNNKLVVADEEIGSWGGSEYTGVTGLVQSGRNEFAWDGSGIVTSMTDATTSVLTTLAVSTAEAAFYDGGTFGGVSVNAGDVLVMYTWGGDADLNGELNGDDYFRIDSNILQSGAVFGYSKGDFNYDGALNGDDYFIIDSNIVVAQNSPPFPTGSGVNSFLAVPEPGLMGLGALAALSRRRRRVSCAGEL